MNQKLIQFSALFSIIILILLLRCPTIFYFYIDWDEGELMSISWAMTQGQILYKEIPQFHPIFHFLFFMTFFKLFPPDIVPIMIRIFNMVLIFFGALIMARITFKWLNNKLISFFTSVAFVYFLGINNWTLSSYGEFYIIFFIILAYHLMFFYSSNNTKNNFLIGILLGLAFNFKQVAIFDAFSLILAMFLMNNNKIIYNLKNFKFISYGFLTALLAGYIYPLIHNSTIDTFNNTLFSTVISYASHNSSSFSLSNSLLNMIIKIFSIINTLISEFFQTTHFISFIIIIIVFIYILLIIYKNKNIFNILPQYKIFICILIWFIIDVIGLTLIGRFYTHYLIQLIPSSIFIFAFLLHNSNKYIKVCFILLTTFFFYANTLLTSYEKFNSDFLNPAKNIKSKQIASFVKQNTKSFEKIFLYKVASLDIFYLSKRLSCNGIYMFIVMDSKHTNNITLEKKKEEEFLNNLPTLFLYGYYNPPKTSHHANDFFTKILSEKYYLLTTISDIKIYKLK